MKSFLNIIIIFGGSFNKSFLSSKLWQSVRIDNNKKDKKKLDFEANRYPGWSSNRNPVLIYPYWNDKARLDSY